MNNLVLWEQLDEIQKRVTEEDGETLVEELSDDDKEFIRQVGSNGKAYLTEEPEFKDFERRPDREIEGDLFRYEHKKEDIAIVVVRKGNVIDVIEKAGGYTEHEIAENLESVFEAKERAEQYIKSGEDDVRS